MTSRKTQRSLTAPRDMLQWARYELEVESEKVQAMQKLVDALASMVALDMKQQANRDGC